MPIVTTVSPGATKWSPFFLWQNHSHIDPSLTDSQGRPEFGMIFLSFVIAVLCPSRTVSGFTPPEFVRLGGLFPSFDFNGAPHTQARQLLSSFLMAVKDINADKTILPNTTLLIAVRDSRLNVGKAFFSSFDLATTAFGGRGIDACIGADSSAESEAAATVFTQFSTVQISYSSTSPLLSTKISYPFFARTCPSDAFQGAAMADLVASYGWREVSTFANSDTYGSNGINQFQSSAAKVGVQILSASLLPVGQTNFAIPIAEALKVGSRIFVFFMTAKDMGALLLQGYQAGLFGVGTQIIASDASTASAALWANMPSNLVTTIMKGVIGFAPSSDYLTPQGSSFLKELLKQKNTVANKYGYCNNQTDDTGHFLFKEALNPRKPNSYNCSGLNFSKYSPDGSNVDNYSPYTYDATRAIAKAMHQLLYVQQQPNITGKALFAALINNVSFVGATGPVNFSHALTSDSTRFAEGDRRTGVSYRVMNFNPYVYNADPSGGSGYAVAGSWSIEAGIKITGHLTYNTLDGSPPSDLPPTIYLHMGKVSKYILLALALLLFITTSGFAQINILFRKTRLLKTIQLKMQFIIIMGGFFGAVRVLTGMLPVSDMICSLHVWFGHLSFWCIFCPMMLKTWRVHKIVNNKTLRRVTITENYILLIFSCMIAFVVCYLAFLQGLNASTPIMVKKMTKIGVQYYSDDQCSSRTIGFEVALIVLEACMLFSTVFLCYVTKDVPGALNEAQNNLSSIFIVSCVAIVVFPLVSMTSLDEGIKQLISSGCIFVCVFSTIGILFTWRTLLLLRGYDIDVHLHLSRKNNFNDTIILNQQSSSMKEGHFGGYNLNPFEAVKTKNLLNRRQTCKEQVSHWTGLLRNTEAMMLVQDEVRPRTVAVEGAFRRTDDHRKSKTEDQEAEMKSTKEKSMKSGREYQL